MRGTRRSREGRRARRCGRSWSAAHSRAARSGRRTRRGQRRREESRGDGVAGDPVGDQYSAVARVSCMTPPFARRRGRVRKARTTAATRCSRSVPSPGRHRGRETLRQQERRPEVERDVRIEGLAHVRKRLADVHAGGVHEDVDRDAAPTPPRPRQAGPRPRRDRKRRAAAATSSACTSTAARRAPRPCVRRGRPGARGREPARSPGRSRSCRRSRARLPVRSKSSRQTEHASGLDRLAHVEIVARKILPQPVVRGAGMRLHALEARDARGHLRDARRSLAVMRCQVSGLRNLCTERPAE